MNRIRGLTASLAVFIAVGILVNRTNAAPPEVGQEFRNIELQLINGDNTDLDTLVKRGPVAVVFLRGFPGYQCPICSRQVASLIKSAEELSQFNASVVFIYPGSSTVAGTATGLEVKAKEFLRDAKLPSNFYFALDPDFKATNKYSIRWDAPRETAYPSTFVIDQSGNIRFSNVSRTHGGRTSTEVLLAELRKLPNN